MNLEVFTISAQAPLKAALEKIEANQHGLILTLDQFGAVIGLATDGDIRAGLIAGNTLEDCIGSLANLKFVWADSTTSRETLLKKFDRNIKVIPLLNSVRKLTGIVTRDNLPLQLEERTYARSRSPVRISFGGGGSDLTHYFDSENGAVINTTISLYSHAILRIRDDVKVIIHSRDLGASLHAENLQNALSQKGQFGLIQAILKLVDPEFGFELFLHSDYPMNSGLGGSAVVSAAVLGCFNQFRHDKWDLHELAELAFQAERLYLGVSGGWQDQYATVFGGINFMEFRMEQNIVHPLRIHPETLLELEESLILCDTGISHESGEIHKDQREHMQQSNIRQHVQANVELSYRMRNQLLRGRLLQFGQSLHEAWELKRQFSSKISSIHLDKIYDNARKCGALGGKLLGAGGGGFFLFYVPSFRKHNVMAHLEGAGLKISPFRFEQEGLQSWTVRECNNHIEAESL